MRNGMRVKFFIVIACGQQKSAATAIDAAVDVVLINIIISTLICHKRHSLCSVEKKKFQIYINGDLQTLFYDYNLKWCDCCITVKIEMRMTWFCNWKSFWTQMLQTFIEVVGVSRSWKHYGVFVELPLRK